MLTTTASSWSSLASFQVRDQTWTPPRVTCFAQNLASSEESAM